jgi:hypothetical protein
VEVGAGFAHRVAGKGYGKSVRQNQYRVSCTKCKDRYDQEERRQQDFLRELQEDYKRRTTKMKTEHDTKPITPNTNTRTLSDYIGAVNAKINWVASIAASMDAQILEMDEARESKELPPRWPGAYIEKAPKGLKMGVFNTTLNPDWHTAWIWRVEVRCNVSPLLQALLEMYKEALAEVEALLSQDLVPLDEGIVQPPKIQTPY